MRMFISVHNDVVDIVEKIVVNENDRNRLVDALNELDDKAINKQGFAYRDIIFQDKWETFTPSFTNLTTVG